MVARLKKWDDTATRVIARVAAAWEASQDARAGIEEPKVHREQHPRQDQLRNAVEQSGQVVLMVAAHDKLYCCK